MRYIRDGNPRHIATRDPGDLHRPGVEASYWTTSERYADRHAKRVGREGSRGMVLQQRVPSSSLDSAYCFPERPGDDFHQTVYHNRAQLRTPREPEAVGRSRHTDRAIAPTSGRETGALLRMTQRYRSGPQFEAAFSPEVELSASDGSDVDEDRKGPRYIQQIRFQRDALDELSQLPRHGRPVRPQRRR